MDAGPNSMLIQITDPTDNFPTPKFKFKEIHQFEFLDGEIPSETVPEEFLITEEQAKKIAELLIKAFKNKMNVVVHCQAGICRSGAVVEAGSIIGFTPSDRNFRIPNWLVKKKIIEAFEDNPEFDELISR